MRFIILLLFAFVTAIPSVAGSNQIHLTKQCTGIWAHAAKLPFGGHNFTPFDIVSPNGVFSITGSAEGLSLTSKAVSSRLDVLVNPPLMEILWAPDSRKFVINVSDGGLVGTWESHIYLIDDHGRPIPFNIQNIVTPVSNEILRCEPKEVANFGIATWLNNSKEVLLIVEVPPHSSCRNMGLITGFRVSIETGKVIDRISELQLRKKWSNVLGCRFGNR